MELQRQPSCRGGASSSVCSDLRELNEAKVANILSYLDGAVTSHMQLSHPPHPDDAPHDSFQSEGLSATPPHGDGAIRRPPVVPAPRPPPSTSSGLTSFVIGGLPDTHVGVYHGIKSKIDALRFSNEELRMENEELKSRLAGARQREAESVEKVQSAAHAEMDALRKEMAESVKRHGRATQELQREKEKLTHAVESLTSQLRQEMSRREDEVKRLESANTAAVAQLRSRWQAQEKVAREKWKVTEAKRIKESTLQSLEPDIVLLLNRHKAEKARMREEFENELRQRDEVLAAKEATVEETRAKLAREAEVSMTREQKECRDRLREETERVGRQLEEERRAWRQKREDMEAFFTEQKATLQREIDRLQKEVFDRTASATRDKATLHDTVASEVARITGNSNQIVEDLKERLMREFSCREKETQAQNARFLAAKEEELRRRCEAERDAAIADAAQRVEAERMRALTQTNTNDSVLRDRCEQLARETERLRVEADLVREQLKNALEAVARREEESTRLREAADLTDGRVRAIEEHLRGEADTRLHFLDAEWQRKMRQFEIRHVEEVGAMQHKLEKAARELDAALGVATLEAKSTEQKHCAELTNINERVLVALATKDNTLRAQAEQISLLQEAIRQRDEHIARHKNLL